MSFNSGAPLVEGNICVKATVSHRGGWSEEHTIELPLDNMGIKGSVNKTGVHATASTRTYARRYLLKEVFNITTSDDVDTDGNLPAETITEEQVVNIEALIEEVGADHDKFLKVCKVESFDQLPISKYNGAIKRLEALR